MFMFKPFGKYTILKKIASGGMAEIFLATDLSPTGLARFIVIKRALAQYSDNKEFRDMFKNEGKVACNLKHRNIAPIYEFGVQNDQLYLAMEYISGINLRELIKKLKNVKKPIDIRHAVYIVKEVASGLSYAHNAIESNTGQPLNLIHRDISPQNIMLSFDGEIRIIDFGISKIADTDLTRAGHLKGKFSYMSPEQAQGGDVDERTDIFCLGIVLWELLSGQRLFSAKNEMDALKKIRSCNIPNIKKINPKIPNELVNIINQSLSKNKNLRTKTSATLEKELSIFLNKNYPEFSQYDFMSFIKETYSEEILKEREKLKSYSKKFRDYINKLNTKDDFQVTLESNMPNSKLDLPDIDDPIINTQTLTKIPNTQTNTSNNEDQSKTKKPDSTLILNQESSTFLLKEKDSDTITEISKSHSTKTKGFQKDQPINSGNSQTSKVNMNFDIINNGKESLLHYSNEMATKNKNLQTKSKSYRTNKILPNYKNEKTIDLIKNMVAVILILSIGISGVYTFKNKEKIISSKKWDKLFKEKIEPQKTHHTYLQKNISEPARNIENVSVKKVWIQTKPSGATIYMNKKAIANTPTLLDIHLNKFTGLTIYKQGYFPYPIQKHQVSQLDNSLSVTLQKNIQKVRPKNIVIIK